MNVSATLRLLSASEAVGISGGAMIAERALRFLGVKKPTEDILKRTAAAVSFAITGMIFSTITGSIIPLAALSLIGGLVVFDQFSEQADIPVRILFLLSLAINTVASGVLLYMQPSIYHALCLGLNASVFWDLNLPTQLPHYHKDAPLTEQPKPLPTPVVQSTKSRLLAPLQSQFSSEDVRILNQIISERKRKEEEDRIASTTSWLRYVKGENP